MDPIQKLRRAVEKAGGQRAWSRTNKVSVAYVNDVLHGRRPPGEAILTPLGLEKVITYKRSSNNV